MGDSINVVRYANFPLLSPEEFSREIRTFASEFLDKRNVPFNFLATNDDNTGIFDTLECLNFRAFASFSEKCTSNDEEEDFDLIIEEGGGGDEGDEVCDLFLLHMLLVLNLVV
jgi:hypothetical protein